MTNEEFEKKMEFIVEQQAQFASGIGQLKDAVVRIEDVVGRLANASLKRFEEVEGKTGEKFADVDEKIAALVDSQIRLTDAQSRTDESLRNLIAVVDRYFSEGRNGESQG